MGLKLRKIGLNFGNFKVGFSLIELLIYMAFFSVILVISTDILVTVLDARSEANAADAVDYDGQYILSRLAYDVGRSSNILLPENLGDRSTSLELIIDGENYTYSLNDGYLQLTSGASSDNLNGNRTVVDSVSFQKIGNPLGKETLVFQLTISSAGLTQGRTEVRSYQTVFGRR